MTMRSAVATLCFALAAASVQAQNIPAARMSVLLAESRRAPDARDLLTLRNGIRNGDSETARIAVRALGRLGRPALVRDIAPALRLSLPELRAEAATAIASAVNGTATAAVKSANVTLALTTLSARLDIENEPVVRAAILEALATIPFVEVGQVNQVEAALARFGRSEFIAERLSVARGFEALARLNRSRWTPSAATIDLLRELAGISVPVDGAAAVESAQLLQRDVRVRRLAVEALTEAAAIDETLLRQASVDSDPQVRRLALRAVPTLGFDDAAAAAALRSGLADTQSMVRIEALRIGAARSGAGCQDFIASATDPSLPVALTAIDLLAQCTEPGGIDVLSEIAEALP
ncbi:MAG TPA: hypothetical protein VJP86_15380, partial [Vicinamibacterales bacterium]|nr:hypothetical protein [Vicinamibacterales bacterium]